MSEFNLDIVRTVYDAYESGDLDEVLAAFSGEAEIVEPEALPLGGVYRGARGIEELLVKVSSRLSCTFETDWFADAGDEVIQVGRVIGEVTATGERFSIEEVFVWRLADGQVVSVRPFVNPQAQLDALRRALQN